MMQTYDPQYVVASFLGIPISGYADGTFIKVERDSESFTKMTGAGGEVARARSRHTGGKVTFTLMASSPCNDLLSAAFQADELLGTGVGPTFIKDLNGTTVALAANSWIQKPSSVEFGKEIGTREWVIDCASVEFTVGGTTSLVTD